MTDDLFDPKMFKPRILSIELNPRFAIERLARVNISTRELLMQIAAQVLPPTFIDRGHQVSKQGNSIHAFSVSAGTTPTQATYLAPDAGTLCQR